MALGIGKVDEFYLWEMEITYLKARNVSSQSPLMFAPGQYHSWLRYPCSQTFSARISVGWRWI